MQQQLMSGTVKHCRYIATSHAGVAACTYEADCDNTCACEAGWVTAK